MLSYLEDGRKDEAPWRLRAGPSGPKVKVPGFTIRAYQKNSVVIGPPKTNVIQPRLSKSSVFRNFYRKNDFPLMLLHDRDRIAWRADVTQLDLEHYLPLFAEGLRDTQRPYYLVAFRGTMDLIAQAGAGRLLPIIPKLILPLRRALETREPVVVLRVCKVIQQLANSGNLVGEALVPYFRQLLPFLSLFKNNQTQVPADGLSMSKMASLCDVIESTLSVLDKQGGPDAYINIKYIIPTYE